jgi:CP family cyanate transporter-like MFS transporter
VFAGILLVALNLRIAVTAVSPILAAVRQDVALSDAQAGLLGSIPVVSFALFGSLAPRAARRFGFELTLVGAMLLSAAGEGARSLTSSPSAFLAWSGVALAGMGMGNVLLPPVVMRYFPDRLGSVTAVYSMVLAVSTTLPPLLAAPLARQSGWRFSIGAWAVVGVAACVPWLVVTGRSVSARTRPRDAPPPHPGPSGAGAPARSAGQVWRSPLAWGMALMFAMNSLNAYVMIAWLPQILLDAGIEATVTGPWLALYAFLGLPTSLVVPPLAARMRNPLPIVLFFQACFVGGYLGLMLSPASGTGLWVVLAGLGPGAFPLVLVLINLRTRTALGSVRLSGFSQGIGYALAGIGPVLVGLLHAATGGWTAPFAALFVSVALLLGGAIVACRPVMLEDTWRRRAVARSVGLPGDTR